MLSESFTVKCQKKAQKAQLKRLIQLSQIDGNPEDGFNLSEASPSQAYAQQERQRVGSGRGKAV